MVFKTLTKTTGHLKSLNIYVLSDVQTQCEEFRLSSDCFEEINYILCSNDWLVGEFRKPILEIDINEFIAFIWRE